MTPAQQKLYHAALWSMLISAAAVVVSIAICQIFLGLALIALTASEAPLRFPAIKAPLAAFLGWTLLSLAASPQPSAGLPQVRKIFVYSVLLVVSSVLTETKHARWLVGAWSAAAATSALRSLIQFARKLEAARASGTDFYQYYVAERITGFLSHWMTFGEVGMMVLLVLLGYLFFAPGVARVSRWLGGGGVALVLFSIVVGFTRGIWLATAAGVIYLVWQWRPKLLLAAPVLGLVVFFAAPAAMQRRVQSMMTVRQDDSSGARVIMWRTGLRMIPAHPLFGVGPNLIGREFRNFVPPDVGPLPAAFYEHLHNLYINTAAERGLPALAALLWLFGRILRDHWRALCRKPADENRFILQAVVAVVVATLVGGVFEVNLGDSEVLTLFLAIVSLGYAAIGRQQAATVQPK